MHHSYLFILFLFFCIFSSCNEPETSESVASSEIISPEFPITFTFANYLGDSQNIHPKVLYFEEGWNGYKFWMAYTPYPYGEISAENPSIAVSNDGVTWFRPGCFINPLIGAPIGGYNSDTHLVFNEAKNELECWWREAYEAIKVDRIMRTTSKDGITWTIPEEVYTDGKSMMHLSPAISLIKGVYYIFYCTANDIVLMKSRGDSKPMEWSAEKILPIDWNGLHPWHLDVLLDENEMADIIVCAFTKGNNNNSADLYYLNYDLVNDKYSEPQIILSRSTNPEDIHSRSLYRSSLLKINGCYYIYFSCIDNSWKRYMSLAFGEDIYHLKFHPLSQPLVF